VLFDIYHQQITEGNLLDRILPNLEKIGHFHAASVPGRAELDRGELAYPRLFEEIAAHGYQDFVGLEYFPKEEPLVGLRRLART
jgi:hydroxypyruvate isomerase